MIVTKANVMAFYIHAIKILAGFRQQSSQQLLRLLGQKSSGELRVKSLWQGLLRIRSLAMGMGMGMGMGIRTAT